MHAPSRSAGTTIIVRADPAFLVRTLVHVAGVRMGLSPARFRLIYAGRCLTGDTGGTVENAGLGPECTLHAVISCSAPAGAALLEKSRM